MAARHKRNRNQRERHAARLRAGDERLPEGDDWVEWGGELIWAVGGTSGGAPYGLTIDEFRECNEQDEREAGAVPSRQPSDE